MCVHVSITMSLKTQFKSAVM